ncbi:hypothetical protein ABPG74_002284 [Tetrahymena malaccensis]
MIVQRGLLRLLAAKNFQALRCSFSSSAEQPQEKLFNFTSEHIVTKDQIAKDEQYQELAFKFEREWQKIQRETEDKQRQALDAELTPAQKKRVEFIADAFIELNIMEIRYLNHTLKERLIKTTGLSPLKVNIDWPSLKQLENGSWPPANPNWFLQQEAIAKLWPAGQAGLSQLFGGMMGGGATGGSGAPQAAAAAAAAPAAEKPKEEAPKEKQNYDVELSAIDAAQKIKIIKEVRSILNLGLKEAKDMVEKTPCILKTACKKAEAEELKEKLAAIGCTINLI